MRTDVRITGTTVAVLCCLLLHTTGAAHWLHVRAEHAPPTHHGQPQQPAAAAAGTDADRASATERPGAAAWQPGDHPGHPRAACLDCAIMDPGRICGLTSEGPRPVGCPPACSALNPTPPAVLPARSQLRPNARPPPAARHAMQLAPA